MSSLERPQYQDSENDAPNNVYFFDDYYDAEPSEDGLEELELDPDFPEPMPFIDPMDTPEPNGLIAAGVFPAQGAEADPFPEHVEFFNGTSKYESTPEPEIFVKRTWFSRISEKISTIAENFGRFLDKAVPISMAGIAASTLGLAAPTLISVGHHADTNDSVNVAAASAAASYEMPPPKLVILKSAPVEISSPAAHVKTLWETVNNEVELNSLLIEKNQEIVEVVGGKSADYLHSTTAHNNFLREISKPGRGFSAVLSHHEVAQAKTIAEMINLVEIHFGEKAADIVEGNAAAMRLSASQIQALR